MITLLYTCILVFLVVILVVRRILLVGMIPLAVTSGFSDKDELVTSNTITDVVKETELLVNIDEAIVQFGEGYDCTKQ